MEALNQGYDPAFLSTVEPEPPAARVLSLFDMVENLVEICDENEESILCTLSNRFLNKRIYTQLGDNLIFINPNESLPIYDASVISIYAHTGKSNGSDRRQQRQRSVAHIYGTASKALQNVENGSLHEALLFCGESGSGKSANFFHTLRLLCASERSRISVEQVDALQHICRSFGGAKTLKNACSTRFGCCAKLSIKSGTVSGISVSAALPLELSRLVGQRKGDFNFGILYQLCAGLNADERTRYGIKQASNYFYLNQGRCNIDALEEQSKFRTVCDALRIIGFSAAQRELIFTVLSAILHIGNIFFFTQKTINNEEYAEIANENVVQWVAYLLSIDYDQLKAILVGSPASTEQQSEDATEPLSGPPAAGALKSVDAALDARDALAKILYDDLFTWILSRISLFFQDTGGSTADGVITLFDMFGYERYNNNGYDEFCVNVANEKLEYFHLQRTFAPLIRSARNSGDDDNAADETDAFTPPALVAANRRAVELLTHRPSGIIPLLDDECKFPKGSDETFFQHCNLNHYDKSVFAKARVKDRLEFGVRHTIGPIFYNLDGFLSKNRWQRPSEIRRVLRASHDALLIFLFGDGKNHNDEGDKMRNDRNGDENISDEEEESDVDATVYIASKICENLGAFLDSLKSANCTFVRCVRSNSDRQPNKFDFAIVQRQLRAFCAADACEMLRHAFIYRFRHEEFADEMRCLLPDEVTRGRSALETTRSVLDTQGVDGVAEARARDTYVYVKERLWRQLLELKEFTRNVAALILQRNFRKWLAVQRFTRRRLAAIRLQAGYRAWKARKIVAEKRRQILENIHVQSAVSQTRATVDPVMRHRGVSSSGTDAGETYAEFPELLCVQMQEDERARADERAGDENVRQVTQYLPIKAGAPRPIVSAVSIEEFAEQHLKHHVLGARREPIFAPFLPKTTEQEFSDAILIFKLILRYMNDTTLNANQTAVLAKYIIQKGIDELSQRDEIYVQLCNQTYRNCSEASTTRAWNLLLMAVNAFPPGILVFPMLYSYFQNVRPTALSNLLINGLTRPLVALNPATRSRLFAQSKFEQTALARRQPAVLNARICNGESFAVETDAWTTVNEFSQRVLRHKGIGDFAGWCVELYDGNCSVQIADGQYVFDAAAQFEVPNVRGKNGETNPFVFAAVTDPAAGTKQTSASCQDTAPALNRFAATSKINAGAKVKGHNGTGGDYYPTYVSPLGSRSPYCFENGYANGGGSGAGNKNYGLSEYNEREDSFDANAPPNLRRFDLRFTPPLKEPSDSYAIPRRQNPNCMSRITEEEFAMDGSREATLTRQGVKDDRPHQPRDYSTLSIASRIRNMSVPTGNGDVDKFLDDVFNKALPPTDYDLDPGMDDDDALKRRALVNRIAASIKGGMRHGDEFSYFDGVEMDEKNYSNRSPSLMRSPLSSGITSPVSTAVLGDCYSPPRGSHQRDFSNGSEIRPTSHNGTGGGRQIVYNGRNYYNNGDTKPTLTRYRPPPSFSSDAGVSEYSDYRQPRSPPSSTIRTSSTARHEKVNGLRRCPPLKSDPNADFALDYNGHLGSEQPVESLYGGSVAPSVHSATLAGGNVVALAPPPTQLRRSVTADTTHHNGYHDEIGGVDEESHIYGHGGFLLDGIEDEVVNDWVHEAELSFNDTVASMTHGHSKPRYDFVLRKSSRADSNVASVGNTSTLTVPVIKTRPAVEFACEPFTITVRKEIFAIDEELDDGTQIDLIFAQIIADCRRGMPLRIRKYERETINQILRSHRVRPSSLNALAEIATKVKVQVIDAARKWPLYFCRFYPCIEERPSDRVPLLLGVSETGIRLVSQSSQLANGATSTGGDTPTFIIQDHFEYSDISELVVENQKSLRLITRQSISVLITSLHAPVIKKCIEQYINGTIMNKQFVVATADYATAEPNLLSFECGEFIQIMSGADTKCPLSGSWLYGKLDNRFGWFPADYVRPVTENQSINGDYCVHPVNQRLASSSFDPVGSRYYLCKQTAN